MRAWRGAALVLALAAGTLPALEVRAAEENLRRLEALVGAGAAPLSALRAARQQLRDAQNQEVLRRTLYATEVEPALLPEMLRAAQELRARAVESLGAHQQLVRAGALPARELEQRQAALTDAEQQWQMAQSRARLVEEIARMARREADYDAGEESGLAQPFLGGGALAEQDFLPLEEAYFSRFSRPLPVSARGATAVHRGLGFDHQGRFDVALNPDQPEGRWLLDLLDRLQIPYIAFRGAVAGRSTGAHIHVGLPSPRL